MANNVVRSIFFDSDKLLQRIVDDQLHKYKYPNTLEDSINVAKVLSNILTSQELIEKHIPDERQTKYLKMELIQIAFLKNIGNEALKKRNEEEKQKPVCRKKPEIRKPSNEPPPVITFQQLLPEQGEENQRPLEERSFEIKVSNYINLYLNKSNKINQQLAIKNLTNLLNTYTKIQTYLNNNPELNALKRALIKKLNDDDYDDQLFF